VSGDQKVDNVIQFYLLACRLKNLIRSGWGLYRVSAPRLESVAEHIFGTQMLAIGMALEFGYRVDLRKVLMMLAIHELGEVFVGDITIEDEVSKKEKSRKEMDSLERVLGDLASKEEIRGLFLEYEKGESDEAKFAKQIDKLEADLQVRIYDDGGFIEIPTEEQGVRGEIIQEYYGRRGWKRVAEAWVDYDLSHAGYDETFRKVAETARDKKLEVT